MYAGDDPVRAPQNTVTLGGRDIFGERIVSGAFPNIAAKAAICCLP
jgi:hypothetical protein